MQTSLARGFAISIMTLAMMAGSAHAAGPAEPAAPPPSAPSVGPDRSQLSELENVTINATCFPRHKQGEPAFNNCVAAQIAALKQHPSPDRSSLSAERNQEIEYACANYQTRGIAAYNDCLTQQISAHPQDAQVANEVRDPDLADAVKQISEEKPEAIPVAASTVGGPASVLPKLAGHLEDKVLSAQEFFKKTSPSVYVVLAAPSQSDFRGGGIIQGSAVAVTDHLLLTNCHVVNDRPFIRIFLDRVPTEATLVGADRAGDRCVLRADRTTLVPVSGIRPYEDLAQGEHVFAIGTPIGLQHTLSEGLISGLHHLSLGDTVQTTAPISPGSSGGGLFDDRGNLIGITTLNSGGRLQNLNFAVAASDFWK